MNVLDFASFRKKRQLSVPIEELDLLVCTYNFLKKKKVKVLKDLEKEGLQNELFSELSDTNYIRIKKDLMNYIEESAIISIFLKEVATETLLG